MLQRAASNAYSWWWASHIRTKQSKWLDNNLQDMEAKVKSMLKLIEEDADSFAKRAEMYFRKRPELIGFVEESYRAYRALAERYDHISGELHKANHTIATVFPDQVQFAMEDEADDNSPRAASSIDPSKFHKPLPEIPQVSFKGKSREKQTDLKKSQPRRISSQMNKDKAQEEIDRIQKKILVLQTEKEFVKSSYESGLAKYWDIEKQITEMQEETCCLQDDFTSNAVIDDDEARALMTATALKSCEETLVNLEEQQKRSAEEARVESKRIKDAKEKLKALKGETDQSQMENGENSDETTNSLEDEGFSLKQERFELQSMCEKVKKHFEMNADTSMVELADAINELVNKVITLELTVSSQKAQIKRLRSETDVLQKHLQSLEEDKTNVADDSNGMSEKLRQAEEELHSIQDLEKCVKDEKNLFQTHLTEACHSLSDLSEKLQSSEEQQDVDNVGLSQEDDSFLLNNESQRECKEQDRKSQDRKESLVEGETQGIQDLTLCLKDQESYVQSQEASELDDIISEKPHEAKQDDEVRIANSTQSDDDIHKNAWDMKENLVDEETDGIQGLSISLKDQESNIQTSADDQLDRVSEKLQDPKQEDEVREVDSSQADGGIHRKDDLLELESGIQELNLAVTDQGNHIQSEAGSHLEDVSEEFQGPIQEDEAGNRDSQQADDNSEPKTQNAEAEDKINWQQLLLNGLEGREKILLVEYTTILRNYKETKKRLSEEEEKSQNYLLEAMTQIRELKSANAMKDEEIQSLKQELSSSQTCFSEKSDTPHVVEVEDSRHHRHESTSCFSGFTTESANRQNLEMVEDKNVESTARTEISHGVADVESPLEEEDIKLYQINEPHVASALEEKFRRDIDTLLEENLEFWLRFSTSFHQIQKFRTTFQELQAEIEKLRDTKSQEGSSSSSSEHSVKLESAPINKQLRELKTELQVWLEQNVLLRGELQSRFSSLCEIQEEITRVSIEGNSENQTVQFTLYQAAKFQGEVVNMQQENNKVADELQAGLDHVRGLQVEVEKALSKLHEDFELSGSKGHHLYHFRHFSSRTRIPLRSFLFGAKPKKPSIFSCMNPALQKQYSDLRAGFPT